MSSTEVEPVISAPPGARSSVGRALVLAGAAPFKEASLHNVSDTYFGQVRLLDGSIIPAVIKDLPIRELANEVLAAALALEMELPVPPAYLAVAPSDHLITRQAPGVEDHSYVFASAIVEAPPVSQWVVRQGRLVEQLLRPLVAALVQGGRLGEFYAFDSWAANIDRHPGNVLFSGPKATWLIDHARCFTGPDWTAGNLVPEAEYPNRLKEWVTIMLEPNEADRYSADALEFAVRLNSIDISAIGTANDLPALLGMSDFNAVIRFLEERIAFVATLAARALGKMV